MLATDQATYPASQATSTAVLNHILDCFSMDTMLLLLGIEVIGNIVLQRPLLSPYGLGSAAIPLVAVRSRLGGPGRITELMAQFGAEDSHD